MIQIENWDKIKNRMIALWNNEVLDRPVVAVRCNKDINNPFINSKPWKSESIKDYYRNPECILERWLDRINKTYHAGDALPIIYPNLGVCGWIRYFMSPEQVEKHVNYGETVWYTPILENSNSFNFHFTKENEEFQLDRQILKYLNDESKGRYLVGQPDNGGCYDILGALRGNETLMMDFLEQPDEIREAANRVIDTMIESEDELFAVTNESCDGGSGHGWMSTWSPGKHMQMQCDLSVMISHQMYEDFIMEELERVTNWLDHSIYHLDGIEQTRFLDLLLSLKRLNMIQWSQVAGQPPLVENLHHIRRIQEAGKGVVLGISTHDLDKILNDTYPQGRIIYLDAKDKEEADAIVDYVAKHSFRRTLF